MLKQQLYFLAIIGTLLLFLDHVTASRRNSKFRAAKTTKKDIFHLVKPHNTPAEQAKRNATGAKQAKRNEKRTNYLSNYSYVHSRRFSWNFVEYILCFSVFSLFNIVTVR